LAFINIRFKKEAKNPDFTHALPHPNPHRPFKNHRVRENLCNTLTRKFIDEMKLYQGAQQKYKSDIKKKVTRQVQIVKPDATNEEIDLVMRSEGGKEALYKETILAGGVADPIK